MATIILLRDNQGGPTRRCTASCYNAKGLKCTCICEGLNHGAGYDQAVDNAHREFDWVRYDEPDYTIIISPVSLQLFKRGKP